MPIPPDVSSENVVEQIEAFIDDAIKKAKAKSKNPISELEVNLGKFSDVVNAAQKKRIMSDYKAARWINSRWITMESLGDTPNTVGCFKILLKA